MTGGIKISVSVPIVVVIKAGMGDGRGMEDMQRIAEVVRGAVVPESIPIICAPYDVELSALDEDAMRAAGWVRAPDGDRPA